MSQQRIERINELILREMGPLFLREVEFPIGSLATITRVDTSKDLFYAHIYISVLPANKTGSVLTALRKNVGRLQFLLNKRLKMHPSPRIEFRIDTTEEKAEEVEKVINEVTQE